MASVIILTWELALPGCRSLKQKRATILSLKDRLRQRFKVSVAETRFQDSSDRAELTVAFVASDGRLAESLAGKIERFVVEKGGALVTSSHRERV